MKYSAARPTKIRVRDINETQIGILSDFMEATFVPRWNGVGTWTLKVAANADLAMSLVPGCGINVDLPDGTQFSGHATDYLDSWDTEQDTGDGTITISGVEDKAILGYRLVLPNPAADPTAQTAVASYVQSGPVESLIKLVVRDNLGDRALASRRLDSFFVAPDAASGPSTTISARYDNLLDLVQRLASPVGYGFTLLNSGGSWTFDTAPSVDVSSVVQFSRALGNMTSYKFGRTAPKLTRAIVAGGGVGTARNVRTYDQVAGAIDPAWGFLIEQFIDRRDTTLGTDMLQSANEAFQSNGEQVALSATVIDTDEIKIGRDYRLGSIVSMNVRGVTYSDIVSEINYSIKPDQTRIQPTIGGADAVYGRALDVYRVVRSISARLALLERRQ